MVSLEHDDVLIAHVGHQPAAIAAFLASWEEQFGPPVKILLLATKHHSNPSRGSWPFGEAVKAMFPSLPINLLQVSENLHETDVRLGSPAPRLVAEYLATYPQARATFFVSPGLSYQVAALAMALPSSTRFVESSTEGFRFFIPGGAPQESFEGIDLGLTALMRLHGHAISATGDVREPVRSWLERTQAALPIGCVKGMQFPMIREPILFDLAFEAGGWLHVLVAIPEAASELPPVLTQGKNPDETKKLFKAYRLDAVRSVARARLGLAAFRVRVWIASSDAMIREQATRLELPAIGQKGLAGWLKGIGPVAAPPNTTPWAQVAASDEGGGGDGPPLVVCVGTDPSSTLTSICTHRPAIAVLCADLHTPQVAKSTELIRKVTRWLPSSLVHVVSTDRLGSGLAGVINDLLSDEQRAKAKRDVTPGTNAQSVALAKVSFGQTWSLNLGAVRAERLVDGAGVDLRVASLPVQGTANGGELVDVGDCANDWPSTDRDFILRAGRMLARTLPKAIPAMGMVYVDGLRIKPHKKRERAQIVKTRRVSGAPLSAADYEEEGPWRKNGGYLEDIVAAAFVEAGADEVRANMKWAWSPDREADIRRRYPGDKQRPFTDEADVSVRWRSQFICVDAKAKSRPENPDGYDELLRSSEKAASLFGRFCLPLVCHMNATSDDLRRYAPGAKGAALIGLATLLNPQKLEAFLDAMIAARRTTGK